MTVVEAERLRRLPPYLFTEIDRLKAELIAGGADVINLGVGDPDLPTPYHIIEKLAQTAKDQANHQYPSYSGMNGFRVSVAKWYKRCERRDILIAGLKKAGLHPQIPKATFYVWRPNPPGCSSTDFTFLLLREAGIVTTPGSGFGDPGEGYVRMALTVPRERIREAVERICKLDLENRPSGEKSRNRSRK